MIDGGVTDLADHFMTSFIYPIIEFINQQNHPIKSIIIVSGDHAGWCNRYCFEKILKLKNMTNVTIENISSIKS